MSTSNPYSDRVTGYEAGTACTETGVADLTDNGFAVYDADTSKMVSAPLQYASSSFYPTATLSYSIGTSANIFSAVYSATVDSGSSVLDLNSDQSISFTLGSSVYANLTSSYFYSPQQIILGSASNPWAGTYTNLLSSGTSTDLNINATAGTGYLKAGGSNVLQWNSSVLSPTTNFGCSLGTSSNKYQDLYANAVYTSNVITTGGALEFVAPSSGYILTLSGSTPTIYFNSTGIVPYSDNTFNLGSTTSQFNKTYSGTVTIDYGEDYQITIGDQSQGSLEIGNADRTAAGTPFIDFHSSTYGNDYDVRIIASGGTDGAVGGGALELNSSTINIIGDQVAKSGRGNKGAGYVGGYTQYSGVIESQALSALTWGAVYSFTVPTTGNVLIFGNIQISSLTTAGVQSAGLSTSTGEVDGYSKGTGYGTTTCPACINIPPLFDYGGGAQTYYLNVMSSSAQSACYIAYRFVVLNIN